MYSRRLSRPVEIGWRLSSAYWGQGLATEGAREVVRYAFNALDLSSLVSFTAPANVRSIRVMEKLGMKHDVADDFDHPLLFEGHPLRRHVLYRLDRSQSGRLPNREPLVSKMTRVKDSGRILEEDRS
jgi:RimJ/RimL family protein N-acetyltransferase